IFYFYLGASKMTFGPFPAALQNAIQQNFLERAFVEALLNVLAYREIADKEVFPGRIGDTITKTRVGLMIPNIVPLNPNTNTNLDNGLSPQQYSDEQYTLAVYQYPQLAPDINLIDDETTIAAFAMKNAENLGIAQATALDRIARNALFQAYMSGNTVLTQSLTNTVQNVDDTRGFQTVVVNGSVQPVSNTNQLPVFVNGVLNYVVAYTNDATNISSAASTGGTSGTITLASSVTGTAGQTVIGQFAPLIIRPNARTSTAAIQSTDLLNMTVILAAVSQLRNNAVPKIRGAYNLYLNSTSMNELFQDPEFQILNRGVSTRDPVYENAWVYEMFLDVRFIMTTETFVQLPQASAPVAVAQTIQRPIICGAGCLVEGMFTRGLDAIKNMNSKLGVGDMQTFPTVYNVLGEEFSKQGFYMYMRPPLDRLAQIISQSSNYIGGFTVPTDVTTNPSIIPTASNAYYKRAVIIETA
ncbi:MAG: DUF4043 domain-containing protein, partial [Patescibacteria group bacterium]|nr:DUF4043 domain-containing protein [Patescibacteria group bacterium]